MNQRLVSYLEDNRDFIIETWLTEADLPPPQGVNGCEGSVPVAFLESLFDRVLDRLCGRENCHCPDEKRRVQFREVLGVTCACQSNRLRGHVCLELHDSAVRAFQAVFVDEWDPEGEFNQFDREMGLRAVHESLSFIFGQEIFGCPKRVGNAKCPFTLN